ncbi:MAG: thioesterase family protein [Acidimicrobiales bacterium]
MTEPNPVGAARFDATDLVAVAGRSGEYAVTLDDGWLSLVAIHGGYMVALATRAAEATVPDRVVRTVATSFIRRGRPGPAHLVVTPIRLGRTVAQVAVELRQDDRTVLTARVTMGDPALRSDPPTEPAPLDLPPPGACVTAMPVNAPNHFSRADGLLDPSSLPFSHGPVLASRGYIRPLVGPADAAWLTMACDWFPPPAFVRLTPPTGGVSIDMLTHIHRVPTDPGQWLAAWFELESGHDGLAVERGRILTPDGLPVADSVQTRLLVGERRVD